MNRISNEDIVRYTQDHAAAEIDNYGVVYYLHITDDGEIVDLHSDSDFTAAVFLRPSDYGMTAEEFAAEETPDFVYAREVVGDRLYDWVVADLANFANEYLAKISED